MHRDHGAAIPQRSPSNELDIARLEEFTVVARNLPHYMNNMLTPVLGPLCLSLMEMKASHPLYGTLRDVRNGVQAIAAMVRELAQFGRRNEPSPRAIVLQDFLPDLAAKRRPELGSAVTIKVSITPHTSAIHADPSMVEQILDRLIRNAAEAMPAGGVVEIHARNAEMEQPAGDSALEAERHVSIRVCDRGPGIAPSDFKKMYEPFFTTKDKTRHMGLGLTLVRGYVALCGGHLEAKTESGSGSAFTVYFRKAQND